MPAVLDHVDELLRKGTIGGEQRNAAAFQIGTSVRLLMAFADLAPALKGREAARFATELMPDYPTGMRPASSRPSGSSLARSAHRADRSVYVSSHMRSGGSLLAAAALILMSLAFATDARAAAKRCSGKAALIGGQSVCLKIGNACSSRLNARYVKFGLTCRRGGKPRRLRLARASLGLRRRGAPVLVGAGGLPSRAAALQAFVSSVAPLPGVKPIKGSVGTLRSGSGPLRWVLRHRKTLTAAQRKALDAFLRRASRPPARTAELAKRQLLAEQATDAAVKDVAERFNFDLAPATVVVAARAIAGKADYAFTIPADAKAEQSGPLAKCQIEYYPAAFGSATTLRITAAHEVTHCFQYRASGTLTRGLAHPAWLMEGFAEWAGAQVAARFDLSGPITPISDSELAKNWKPYLLAPDVALQKRTYDALGFFAQLYPRVNPWRRWTAMQAAKSTDAMYAAAFPTPMEQTTFLNAAPAGLFRRPALGPLWDVRAPGIPKAAAQPEEVTVAGGAERLEARPYTSSLYRLVTPKPVIKLRATGELNGRLKSGANEYAGAAMGTEFCTRPGGCACPNGSKLDIPPLGKDSVLALAADGKAVEVDVSGLDLADACERISGTDLLIAGAVTRRITVDGSCAILQSGSWYGAFITEDDSKTVSFSAQFAGYHGAGTYPIRGRLTSDPPKEARNDFAQVVFDQNVWSNHDIPGRVSGSITINENVLTGSVSVVMANGGAGSFVQATGRFTCVELV